MADYAAMPIFIDAWALDTGHLGDAEDGRYFRLCRLLWSCPRCRVPNDDTWLARKLNRTVEEVVRDFRPLIGEFFKTDANWIWHKRLIKEYLYVVARSKSQSERAKSRWNKRKKNASAVPDDSTRQRSGNAPTPTPTPSSKRDSLDSAEGLTEFEAWYAAYPRHVGHGQALKAYRGALRKATAQTLLDGALAAARRYASTQPEFIPHPATWLNGERWLDRDSVGAGPRITPLGVGG